MIHDLAPPFANEIGGPLSSIVGIDICGTILQFARPAWSAHFPTLIGAVMHNSSLFLLIIAGFYHADVAAGNDRKTFRR